MLEYIGIKINRVILLICWLNMIKQSHDILGYLPHTVVMLYCFAYHWIQWLVSNYIQWLSHYIYIYPCAWLVLHFPRKLCPSLLAKLRYNCNMLQPGFAVDNQIQRIPYPFLAIYSSLYPIVFLVWSSMYRYFLVYSHYIPMKWSIFYPPGTSWATSTSPRVRRCWSMAAGKCWRPLDSSARPASWHWRTSKLGRRTVPGKRVVFTKK